MQPKRRLRPLNRTLKAIDSLSDCLNSNLFDKNNSSNFFGFLDTHKDIGINDNKQNKKEEEEIRKDKEENKKDKEKYKEGKANALMPGKKKIAIKEVKRVGLYIEVIIIYLVLSLFLPITNIQL